MHSVQTCLHLNHTNLVASLSRSNSVSKLLPEFKYMRMTVNFLGLRNYTSSAVFTVGQIESN